MLHPYDFIASEIYELESLLASIPEGNIIEKMSLESRLEQAREKLATLTAPLLEKKLRLTFKGAPVYGNHGISADFAAKAAGAFASAFAAVSAGMDKGLSPIGPIPDRIKNQLLITGTAVGSFGFEFELPPVKEPGLFPEQEQAEIALVKIKRLLQLAAEGTDDEVSEIIEDIDPRAMKKVSDFLEILVQQQAWCGLEFGGSTFRYKDHEQIRSSSSRIKDDNIRSKEDTFLGELQGVLPSARSFEFKPAEQGELIRGKLHHTIEDPHILNREWLHKPVIFKLHVMQLGKGRPRYTLMSMGDICLQ